MMWCAIDPEEHDSAAGWVVLENAWFAACALCIQNAPDVGFTQVWVRRPPRSRT